MINYFKPRHLYCEDRTSKLPALMKDYSINTVPFQKSLYQFKFSCLFLAPVHFLLFIPVYFLTKLEVQVVKILKILAK